MFITQVDVLLGTYKKLVKNAVLCGLIVILLEKLPILVPANLEIVVMCSLVTVVLSDSKITLSPIAQFVASFTVIWVSPAFADNVKKVFLVFCNAEYKEMLPPLDTNMCLKFAGVKE